MKVQGFSRRVRKSRERLLTIKELAFVEAYIGPCKGNGTEAARAAGYDADNASLASIGSQLIRRPRVNRAIGRALAKRHATKPEILGELSEVALAPWRDFVQVQMDAEGNMISAKLRLADKVRALELLGKASGALSDPLTRAVEALLNRELSRVEDARARLAERDRLEAEVVNAEVTDVLAQSPGTVTPGTAVRALPPAVDHDGSAARHSRSARLDGVDPAAAGEGWVDRGREAGQVTPLADAGLTRSGQPSSTGLTTSATPPADPFSEV